MKPPLSLLTLALLVPISGSADPESTVGDSGEVVQTVPRLSAPSLNLERLLRPPRVAGPHPETPGGKDREAWSTEFSRLRGEIADLEQQISLAQEGIREAAPDDWSFSPTGGGMPSDPEVLRLRAQLRRDRQSLEAARQRLRDLDVEASLAGVPDGWKQPLAGPAGD